MYLTWQYICGTFRKVNAQKSQTARTFDRPLQVRVSDEIHELIRRAAEKDGRTVSNWIRDRLQKIAQKELK